MLIWFGSASFCKLVPLCSIFQGYGAFRYALVLNFIRDVEKKVSYLYHIYTPGERVSPTTQIGSKITWRLERPFAKKSHQFFGELFFGPIFLCRPFPYSLPSGSSALPLKRGRQPESWNEKIEKLLWYSVHPIQSVDIRLAAPFENTTAGPW